MVFFNDESTTRGKCVKEFFAYHFGAQFFTVHSKITLT